MGVKLEQESKSPSPNVFVIVATGYSYDYRLVSAIKSVVAAYFKGSDNTTRGEGLPYKMPSDGTSATPLDHPELLEATLQEKMDGTSLNPLSPREVEVLSHIARGNANKQIANVLGISEQTVKNHVSRIMGKMDAQDRTHAVVMAIEKSWISL